MENQFGHGFVTSIMLIAMHFALPSQQAWLVRGTMSRAWCCRRSSGGTDVEEPHDPAPQKSVWTSRARWIREDAREVLFTLKRLVVAIDQGLGISDAGFGEFR